MGRDIEDDFTRKATESDLSDEEAKNAFNKNMMSTGLLDDGPKEYAERFGRRWLVTAYEAGDVVLHNPFAIHASTINFDPGNRIRVGTDLRFVDASKPWDTVCWYAWLIGEMLILCSDGITIIGLGTGCELNCRVRVEERRRGGTTRVPVGGVVDRDGWQRYADVDVDNSFEVGGACEDLLDVFKTNIFSRPRFRREPMANVQFLVFCKLELDEQRLRELQHDGISGSNKQSLSALLHAAANDRPLASSPVRVLIHGSVRTDLLHDCAAIPQIWFPHPRCKIAHCF